MATMLARNASDWTKTPLEPQGPDNEYVGWSPYPVIIPGWKREGDGVRFYFDVIDGEFAEVYAGIKGFHNSFLLKDFKNKGMLKERLNSISLSNPGFDATQAWLDDDFDAFVGKIVGITYKAKSDGIRTEVKQNAVLPIDYEQYAEKRDAYIKKYGIGKAKEQPEQAPGAPVVDASIPPILPCDDIFKFGYVEDLPAGDDELDEPVILVDTRQQDGKHEVKHQRLRELGYKLQVETLNVGDYMLLDKYNKPKRSVDTKRDLEELRSNLDEADGERTRFRGEIRRAQEQGIELMFLVTEPSMFPMNEDPLAIAERYVPYICRESCTTYKKGECDPFDYSQMCARHKFMCSKPLCGVPFHKAIKQFVIDEEGIMLVFVHGEVQAAEVIDFWLNGGEW